MYTITTEIDLDTKVKDVVANMRALSPTLNKESEEYLIQKVYEHMCMSEGYVDLQMITKKLTIEYIDKQFQDSKTGKSFQFLYKHKSDRPTYQKRIFNVLQELKKEFPTIKTTLIDYENTFQYSLLIESKRIFNSDKFKDYCKKLEQEYKEKYGKVNYTIEFRKSDK